MLRRLQVAQAANVGMVPNEPGKFDEPLEVFLRGR